MRLVPNLGSGSLNLTRRVTSSMRHFTAAMSSPCEPTINPRPGKLWPSISKHKRLYKLIEDGVTEIDDVLKDRLNTLKADRDRSKAALERAKSHSSNAIQIDPALLERFGRTMRENFAAGSIPFRKAYLQSLVSAVEVDDTTIRIKGSRDILEKAVLASRNGAVPGSQMSTEWRSLGELNPCFSLERAAS